MTKSVAVLFGVALALTITAAPAAEDPGSANYFLRACQDVVAGNVVPSARHGLCVGTIRGIIFMGGDLHGLQLDYSSPPNALAWLYCLDVPGEALEQALRFVVSYIEARPARLHESFNHLALEALRTVRISGREIHVEAAVPPASSQPGVGFSETCRAAGAGTPRPPSSPS